MARKLLSQWKANEALDLKHPEYELKGKFDIYDTEKSLKIEMMTSPQYIYHG